MSCPMVRQIRSSVPQWMLNSNCVCTAFVHPCMRHRLARSNYIDMVPRGLEPRTLWLLAIRSNQLSYETSENCCYLTKLQNMIDASFRGSHQNGLGVAQERKSHLWHVSVIPGLALTTTAGRTYLKRVRDNRLHMLWILCYFQFGHLSQTCICLIRF